MKDNNNKANPVLEKHGAFINRLVEFDKSLNASFIPRLLSQKGNLAEAISHMLDRYMLSLGKDCAVLPGSVYDPAYERNISMVSHNVDNGRIIVHFTTGGYADFLNLCMESMVAIASKIMNCTQNSER